MQLALECECGTDGDETYSPVDKHDTPGALLIPPTLTELGR